MDIGPLHVRRSGLIEASPNRVWDEFGSFERMNAWFGQGQTLERYEPKLGGEVLLSVEIEGKRAGFGGEIVVFSEAKELTYLNNWENDGWVVPTAITIRLTPYFGHTHVELFHHGFERLGATAAAQLAGYEAGWDSHHTDALRLICEKKG